MEPACIRHTEIPGASRLFLDFSYHFDRVERFYRHNPHHLESFDEAARLAMELSNRGIAAVPIFWLATEDHDLAEVDHAFVFDADRQPVELRAQMPHANGRPRPVGGITIEKSPIEELRRALHGFPYAEETVSMAAEAYPDGVTMGAGFRALLRKILAPLGLIFIDPLDPEVRKIGAPLIIKALGAAPELKSRLLQRNKELEAAGYHAQVLIEDKTSLFFLLENGARVPLKMKESEYAALHDRAAEVSPNALLRPVMQDYLLPTCAYVGGPAELAYLAQSQIIYDRLLGRMPVMVARAGFTLLEARAVKLLARYKLTIPQTLVDSHLLKERIARALVPETLAATFDTETVGVVNHLNRVRAALDRFDPTLAAALEKSRAKIEYQLEKARRKTAAEMMRRDTRAAADARYLSGLLYPNHHLQERLYSILPFIAAHGPDLVDRLCEAVQLDCPDHRVVSI